MHQFFAKNTKKRANFILTHIRGIFHLFSPIFGDFLTHLNPVPEWKHHTSCACRLNLRHADYRYQFSAIFCQFRLYLPYSAVLFGLHSVFCYRAEILLYFVNSANSAIFCCWQNLLGPGTQCGGHPYLLHTRINMPAVAVGTKTKPSNVWRWLFVVIWLCMHLLISHWRLLQRLLD